MGRPDLLFVLGVAIHHDGDEGGAIQTGIGRLAMRFKRSGTALIVVLMLIFAGVGRRRAVGGNLGSSPDGAAGAGLGYDSMSRAVSSYWGPGRRPGTPRSNPFALGRRLGLGPHQRGRRIL